MSEPKEPHILRKPEADIKQEYQLCFRQDNAKLRIDASTTNSFLCRAEHLDDPNAPGIKINIPERMRTFSPDARIIYVLREPTDRLISAVKHGYRNSKTQPRSIRLAREMERDPMLRLRSEYSFQIERYTEFFPMNSLMFLDYRHLVSDPVAVTNHVLSAFGLEPMRQSQLELSERNTSATSTLLGAKVLNLLPQESYARRLIKERIPRNYWRYVADRILRKPISFEIQDYVEAYESFSIERKRTFALTGVNFDIEVKDIDGDES